MTIIMKSLDSEIWKCIKNSKENFDAYLGTEIINYGSLFTKFVMNRADYWHIQV